MILVILKPESYGRFDRNEPAGSGTAQAQV